MRISFVLIALLLVSCGGQDPLESRITGRFRSSAIGPSLNTIDLIVNQDEKTVSGIADVKNRTYDIDGSWSGSLGPNDAVVLDMTLADMNNTIAGSGTLSMGGDKGDVTIAGHRTGRSFQMSLNPAAGDTLQMSGHLEYDFRDFKLSVQIENIPPGLQGGERRDLQLTVEGKSRGGPLDLFNIGSLDTYGIHSTENLPEDPT